MNFKYIFFFSFIMYSILSGFVSRSGSKFMLDGKSFYFGGTNTYYLHVKSHFMIDSVFDAAIKMKLKVIRCWAFNDGSNGIQYALGQFNESALEPLDYALASSRNKGLKLLLVLTNNCGDYGGIPQYGNWIGIGHDDFFKDVRAKNAYKKYVNFILNHVNKHNGIKYKDDDTIFFLN